MRFECEVKRSGVAVYESGNDRFIAFFPRDPNNNDRALLLARLFCKQLNALNLTEYSVGVYAKLEGIE